MVSLRPPKNKAKFFTIKIPRQVFVGAISNFYGVIKVDQSTYHLPFHRLENFISQEYSHARAS